MFKVAMLFSWSSAPQTPAKGADLDSALPAALPLPRRPPRSVLEPRPIPSATSDPADRIFLPTGPIPVSIIDDVCQASSQEPQAHQILAKWDGVQVSITIWSI
jgi:hypothetical protein